jgi:hypothetical protein
MKGRSLTVALAVLAVVAFALPASAQLQRGNIYGTVVDNTGAVLPGVTLTLSSPVTAPLRTVSGSVGEYHFVQLDPGTYTLAASLQGFAPFTRKEIIVTVGSSVQIPVQMALAGVKQEVTVTAASPVLNEKQHGYETTFGSAALNEVPTARDPWVLMQQVPGVLVDRVNVGGSASGQQSIFSARGDNGLNTTWNIDGVNVTDMAALGSSPTYYDMDVFQEVQYTTAAANPQDQTGALSINMVTKRGTNAFHGLARYYFDNHNLEWNNLPTNLVGSPLSGNRVNQIGDYGGDLGGPILKNKLWFWGSLSKNDIRQVSIAGSPDNTLLKDQAAKIDFQPIEQNHFDFFFLRGNKEKFGRNAGITRPPETTWNQGGPTDVYKFEDSETFGTHLMLTGRYSHVHGGFFLTPQGGLNAQVSEDLDAGSIFHGSYLNYSTNRPQDQANADGNYFRGVHEVKFGFEYRRTPVSSISQWPGNQTWSVYDAASVTGDPNIGLAEITRGAFPNLTMKDTSFYAGDTISLNRTTIDAALRFDRQWGQNLPSNSPANGLAPDVLPALSYPGASVPFHWNNVSPRVGVTYRIDDKTNVRASYALFGAQLGAAYIAYNNPLQLSNIEYYFVDNGTHIPTPSSLLTPTGSSYGVDPANPTATVSPNIIDPNVKAPKTHSVLVALDRELMPNFAISTSVGYGRTYDVLWQHYIGLTSADFVPDPTATATVAAAAQAAGLSTNTIVYTLAPGVSLPAGNGTILTNRPGYHTRYLSWDVTATKRLSNHWMMRGYFNVNSNRQFITDPSGAVVDPTPLALTNFTSINDVADPANGALALNAAGATSGSEGDVFINSKWAYSFMGLYQFPLGISASGTVYGRQGYPDPLYVRVNRGALGSRAQVLLSTDFDANRNPNVNLVDLRAQKSFTFRGVSAILDADLFNAFNNNALLQRNRQMNSTSFGQTREIIAPRIARFGLRIQF